MKKLIALIILFSLLFLFVFHSSSITSYFVKQKTEEYVRKCAVCGSFYPKQKEVLESLLFELFKNTQKIVYNVRALIVPHAGYIYSGKVAAWGFKQLENEDIKKIIIIAPSHHSLFYGVSIPNYTHYETPLGLVKVSKDSSLLRKIFGFNLKAHLKEHAIEVELPFLQYVLKSDIEIIPVLVSQANYKKVANELEKLIDEKTLIIVSSDLSHYHDYYTALNLDSGCINQILLLNISGVKDCEACGKIPILILLEIAKKRNWKPFLIKYANSGDVTKNYQRVVGYVSIAFYEILNLNEKEKEFLLNLAREAIKSKLFNQELKIDENQIPKKLKSKFGCFVTLKKYGMLRGCIGNLFPLKSLYECVIQNAINAAFNDKRFLPLRKEEFNEIKIEISILSLPIRVPFKSREFLDFLKPFKHGVILINGNREATYLPEVWHQLPDKILFLENLCRKAGLKEDCWKWENTTFYVYETVTFKE